MFLYSNVTPKNLITFANISLPFLTFFLKIRLVSRDKHSTNGHCEHLYSRQLYVGHTNNSHKLPMIY